MTTRTWLTDTHRANLARDLKCEPHEVEAILDDIQRMNDRAAERREVDSHPYGREQWR